MLMQRPAAARGHTQTAWLDSRHTFSFGHYHDPAWMGWGALRVLNEDHVMPDAGFGEHGHANMEILTWVLQGALAHRDSTGASGVIRPGELQRMSAGHGIRHSEMNADARAPVHFLQIWLQPDRSNRAPSYAQQGYAPLPLAQSWTVLAAPAAEAGAALPLHAAARVWAWRPSAGAQATHRLVAAQAWLQVARGAVHANGLALAAGDGLGLRGEATLAIHAEADSELLLFELL
ncbi:MAG: pirin family protein [Proteobacteria bacterium]|nr:pirin family protein [Pseudomonadota bacterium]